MRRRFRIITITTLSAFFLPTLSCKEETKTVKPVVISFKKEGELSLLKASTDSIIKTIDIEIADDEYQTQTGMMYRDRMDDHQGMLFVFPREEYHSFYMKNTRIPLDIIYISSDKRIVSIQKNAKPFDETSLPSNAPAQYVLEIKGGLSDAWNLSVGDRMDYTPH